MTHLKLQEMPERMFPIYRNILFVWIQLRRSNEKFTNQINNYYLWNYYFSSFCFYQLRLGMKKFNTWVLDVTIYILDFLYRGRDFQRFWVLEVIARAPYFSFISVLHFRESLGLRGEDHIYLMKEHFYQALNETEHLEEMELREGNKYWIDRFFAKHLVLFYYWIMVVYYFIDPIDAYDINMKIEKHAFETYTKYSAYHPDDTKIAEIAQDELDHSKELLKAMLMIA